MSKVYILLFCLVGCSSNSNWTKNGSPTYNANELDLAKVSCDYKAKMRTANVLMMGSNNAPPSRVLSSEKGKRALNEQTKMSDEKLIRANSKAKQRSLKIGRAAYSCMKNEGFEKK
jgi:hypothetical protein